MTLKSGKVLGNGTTDAKQDDSVEPSGNEENSEGEEIENATRYLHQGLLLKNHTFSHNLHFLNNFKAKTGCSVQEIS